ncbi:hypothetical protein Tco_0782683 [Tanacetum coccineum]
MNASNTKVNSDRSKPVTSQSTPKQEQGVESSHSVRRSTSKDIKSKNNILKNTKSSSTYAIFDNIQLMSNQLKDVPVPLEHFPVPTLIKKVLTFMVKKGKNFSGKVTPLFDSMLVQQTEDEGEASERPSDSQPIPAPPHLSEDQPQTQSDPSPRPFPSIAIPDSNPEVSGGNYGGQSSNDASLSGNEDGLTLQSAYDLCVSLCQQVTVQAKEIKALKAQVKKLKKGCKPLITHHKAWMKSVALKTRLARKTSLKKGGTKGVYPSFEELDDFVDVDDTLDYMKTKDDQDEGRTSSVVLEEKESKDKEVSTKAPVSIDKQDEGTDKRNEGTDKQDRGTDSTKVSTDRQGEGTADQGEGKSATQTAPTITSTPTPTTTTPTTLAPTIFGDDETIAQVLIIMIQNKEKLKEKEKGVKLKDVKEIERPRPTSTRSLLTLRPLPKIDLKAKGKGKIEEEDEFDTESEDITEAEKKFKQLANDEEVARKVQE